MASALVLASCTASTELDATGADRPSLGATPGWITGGRALAAERSRREAPDATVPDGPKGSRDTVAPVDLAAALKASGLSGEQSSCLQSALGGSTDLGLTAADVVDAVARGQAPTGLDSATVASLMIAMGPCLSGTSLSSAAAALAGRATTADAPTAGPLAGSPIRIDVDALQAAVSQFQQALAGSQGDLSRNLLLALAAALAQGAANGALPTVPPTTAYVPAPTLPPDFPTGLNLFMLVDRNAFINNAAASGADRKLAGCLYDRLARLTNSDIASLPPNGTNTALVEEMIRTVFACATAR